MILGEIIIDEDLYEQPLIKQLMEKEIIKIKTEKEFNNLPTLYIGWNVVSDLFKREVSILNKKIKKNIFWTFRPNENLQDFNEDIIEFIDKLYQDFTLDIKYNFIDPIITNINKLEDISKKYQKFDMSYISDDYIYSYIHNKKLILGFDLNYFKFFKFDIEELKKLITQNSVNIQVEDYTLDTGIYQKYKNLLNNDFDKKFVVYLIYSDFI